MATVGTSPGGDDEVVVVQPDITINTDDEKPRKVYVDGVGATILAERVEYLDETGGRYVHVLADGDIHTSGDLAKASSRKTGSRSIEVGMVGGVKILPTELGAEALMDREALPDRHVPVEDPRPNQISFTDIAESAQSR